MCSAVPGGPTVIAAGAADQPNLTSPDYGIFADACWAGWAAEPPLDWPDFGVPDEPVTSEAVRRVSSALARGEQGQRIMVGCVGGLGRTGSLLGLMAAACGVPAPEAVAWVRTHYAPEAVETAAQEEWVVATARTPDVVQRAELHRSWWEQRVERSARQQAQEVRQSRPVLPDLVWAVPGRVAMVHRPLRFHPEWGGRGQAVAPDARPALDAWIAALAGSEIRSLVVLTSDRELRHYDGVASDAGGLVELYRAAGFEVFHHPWADPAAGHAERDAFDQAVDSVRAAVLVDLRGMPLPVAVSCSSTIDRSPPIAACLGWALELLDPQPPALEGPASSPTGR
jgi:hypothetical protein